MASEKQLVKAGEVKAGEEENPEMNKTKTCFAVAGGALATAFVDPTGASAVLAISSGAAGVCGLTYHGLRKGTHMVGNLVGNMKTAVNTTSQQLVVRAVRVESAAITTSEQLGAPAESVESAAITTSEFEQLVAPAESVESAAITTSEQLVTPAESVESAAIETSEQLVAPDESVDSDGIDDLT